MAEDPLVHTAYDELPEVDKGEHKDLKDHIDKATMRRRYTAFREFSAKFNRGRTRKARAQTGPAAGGPAQAGGGAGPASGGCPRVVVNPAEHRMGPGSLHKPFGNGRWLLARIKNEDCWSCVCKLHTKDGIKCNKRLAWTHCCSPEEAKWRIMQWCVDGLTIPNVVVGKGTT